MRTKSGAKVLLFFDIRNNIIVFRENLCMLKKSSTFAKKIEMYKVYG